MASKVSANLRSTHKPSVLLSPEENDYIFCRFASGETSLSTVVIQLVLSSPPDHLQWQLFGTGIMCFVKHNRKRSYFFRLYDFDSTEKIWEQQIYLNIEYLGLESRFHTFEAEDCMAGLNFADEREANDFLKVVHQKIQLLREMFGLNNNKNNEKEYKLESIGSTLLEVPQNNTIRAQSLESVVNRKRFGFKMKSSKKSKAKINKLEIGLPTNFRHIQHIGWSPTTGFDFNVIDPKLHNFFSLAGITENQLQDKDTRKFIFDFIDSHGGIETAIQEAAQPNKVYVTLSYHLLQSYVCSKIKKDKKSEAKAGISSSNLSISNIPNSRPVSSTMPLPPPPPPFLSRDSIVSSHIPPPPPPPPIDLPPPPPELCISNELRSSALDKNQHNSNDDRNELLEQIRGGIRLKKTETIKERSTSSSENIGNPLATALSKALQNRFRVNQMTNHSSEDSDNCDETHFNEWSD